MEVQLEQLIEKIKKDGPENAEKKSEEIISGAEKKAAAVTAKARKEAEDILASAKKDADRIHHTGKEALKQASRDLLIDLRKEITGIFDRIIRDNVGKALSADSLKNILADTIKSWTENPAGDLAVLVSPKQTEELEKGLKTALAEEMKKGLEIRPASDIKAGFRISLKDGSVFYDFSDGELTEMISRYLNPGIRKILEG